MYRHVVRSTGGWSAAEDVVSLTFLEAWRLRERLRPDGDSVLPRLLGIATNVLRNTRRAARRHAAALIRMPPAEAMPDFADEVVDRMRDSEQLAAAAAAVYRAAAMIPGVVLVADSVDAAGRHGVAVARTDESGERTEWIFEATTFEYLGERSYLVRDTVVGTAGMLTATTAVLERAVVQRRGDLPR